MFKFVLCFPLFLLLSLFRQTSSCFSSNIVCLLNDMRCGIDIMWWYPDEDRFEIKVGLCCCTIGWWSSFVKKIESKKKWMTSKWATICEISDLLISFKKFQPENIEFCFLFFSIFFSDLKDSKVTAVYQGLDVLFKT